MKSAPGDSHAIRKVKKAFTAPLTNRFQPDPTGLAVQANLVDPRFRKLTLSAHERKEDADHLKAQLQHGHAASAITES